MTTKKSKELLKKLEQSRSTRSSELLGELSKEKNIFIIHNVSSSVYTDEETLLKFINHSEKRIRFNIAQNEGCTKKVLSILLENETDEIVLTEILYNKRCSKSLKIEVMKKIEAIKALNSK